MVDPAYYLELLSLLDPGATMYMTSNLKDFYLNPDKWEPILKNPNVYVATSFQYGNGRRWDRDTIYSEEKFIDVFTMFKNRIGRTPSFIAVIDESNEDTAFKTVELAKKLGTSCKLNNATKLGKQKNHYPRYKMFQIYLGLIDNGLAEYEVNCLERSIGRCPINIRRLCKSVIRSIYIDSDNNPRYSYCDKIDIGLPIETIRPEPIQHVLSPEEYISEKCGECELINICNACDSNVEQAKEFPEYCEEMIKLKTRIIEAGWELGDRGNL